MNSPGSDTVLAPHWYIRDHEAMIDLEHEAQIKRAELRIQRAKLIGVVATSLAAIAAASAILIPMFSNQQQAVANPTAPNETSVSAPKVEPSTQHEVTPTPLDVCDHVIDLMKRELGDQVDAMPTTEIEKLRDNCVREASKERAIKGEAEYRQQANCVLAAEKLEGLTQCEKVSGDGTPKNRDVCSHVMEIMKREMGSAEGARAPSEDDIQKYTNKCVLDLEKEKAKKGAAEFSRQIKCVMAAPTMEEMMKCEKS